MPASQLTTLFNTNPYYDDYSEDNGFLKALFKPGVAIQARELTQLQSFLQVQLERISSNIFENGSIVAGGGVADFRSNYIRIEETLTDSELSSLIGVKIYSGDIVGRVIQFIKPTAAQVGTDDDHQILIYSSETAGAFASGVSVGTTGPDHPGITVIPNATGTDAISVTVDDGIYYVNGYFVKAAKQTITPYAVNEIGARIFKSPSAAVGFRAKNEIITDQADPSLRDPASGYYNHNAPGADRFKIDLELSFIGFTADIGNASGLSFSDYGDSPFVELVRLVNGTATKKVKYTDYNEIENTLARRTYDESGNYTVTPPAASVYPHSTFFTPPDDTNKFALAIAPHRSYVSGYEMDLIAPSYLEIDKARDKSKAFNEILETNLGQYYYVSLETDSDREPILGEAADGGVAELDDDIGLDGTDKYNAPHTGQLWGAYTVDENGSKVLSSTFQFKCFGNHETIDETQCIKMHAFNYTPGNTTGAPSIVHPVRWENITDTEPLILNASENGSPLGFYLKSGGGNTGGAPDSTDGNGDLIFPVLNERQITEDGIVKTNSHNSTIIRTVMLRHPVTASEAGGGVFVFDGSQPTDGTDLPYVSEVNTTRFTVIMGNDATNTDNPSRCTILSPDKYTIATTSTPVNTLTLTTLNNTGDEDFSGVVGQVITIIATVRDDSVSRPDGDQIYRSITKNTDKTVTISRNETYKDGNGNLTFYLKDAHLISVKSIVDNQSGMGDNVFKMSDAIIDDGQRDDRMMLASVTIPITSLNGDGDLDDKDYRIQVTYSYYSHSGAGPVTTDSYIDAETSYDDIPVYTDPGSGKRRRLSKFIDFRPVAEPSQTLIPGREADQKYVFFGLPSNTNLDSSVVSYMYYLPRIDSVVACDDRTLRVVKGTPSDSPKAPPVTGKDMGMFKINISPYVFNLSDDVNIHYIDNQRSTMSDVNLIENKNSLQKISNRQESLISEGLAAAAADVNNNQHVVADGVFADDFTGHAFGDCSQESYNASMDPVNSGLRPTFETLFVPINMVVGNGLAKSSDGIITHAYEPQDVIRQDVTTFYQNLNPYGVKSWMGYMKLTPYGDFKYSLSKTPMVQANTIGENNNRFITGGSNSKYSYGDITVGKREGMNTILAESVTNWIGRKKDFEYSVTPNPLSRNFLRLPKPEFTVYPNRILRSCQGRLIDESVVPYMTSIGITFTAENLKPASTVFAFIDGFTAGNVDGYEVGTTGHVSDHITISDDTLMSGVKNFRLTDSIENNVNAATTSADSCFYAQGSIDQIDEYSISARPMETRRRSANDEGILSDILIDQRDASLETVKNYIDPLCQNFSVDPGLSGGYDNGMFLDSVDVRFATVDDKGGDGVGLPVTVCIRPTVNGKPHPNKIIPFSTITRLPSQTTLGSGMTDYNTNFKFSSPVYLTPGQYALCVETNSDQYKIHAARVGELILNDEGGPTTSSYGGEGIESGGIILKSLYLPQNNGGRAEDKMSKLSIRLNRCKFASTNLSDEERTVDITPVNASMWYAPHLPSDATDAEYYDYIFVNTDQMASVDAMRTNITVGGDSSEVNTVYSVFDQNGPLTVDNIDIKSVFQPSSGNNTLTPVLDSERAGLILHKGVVNRINGSAILNSTQEQDEHRDLVATPSPDAAHKGEDQPISVGVNNVSNLETVSDSRYISKIVSTPEICTDLKVYFDAAAGPGSGYLVYMRTDAEGPIDNQLWRIMKPGDPPDWAFPTGLAKRKYITNYGESKYPFNKYQVKIVFAGVYHPNTVIKNLKVVPLATT